MEDIRRTGRELGRLKKEHTGHMCRIKSLLALLGGARSKKLPKLSEVCTWNGKPIPLSMRFELEREYERLDLVHAQIDAIHKQRTKQLEAAQLSKQPSEFVRKLLLLTTL